MLRGIGKILAILLFIFLMSGMNTNARAQQTPTAITYEQTIEGSLDATDLTLQNGRRFDQYTFEAEAGRPYVVTIRSDTFAALGLLAFGGGTPLQMAYVFQPGAQVQFSGTLEQLGQYTIVVTTSGDASALGPYTVTLSEQTHGGQCAGGTLSPVIISAGQTLTCTLTEQDVPFTDPQGNTYFGKFFSFQSNGEPFTITAQSNAFPTYILVFDPATGAEVVKNQQSVTVDQLPPGSVPFVVIAYQPNAVGQFTTSITQGDNGTLDVQPPGFLTALPLLNGNMVRLSWTGAPSDDVIAYNVYKSTLPGVVPAPALLFRSVPASMANLTIIDQTVLANTVYYYIVTAIYPNNIESEPSNEASSR